MTLHTYTLQPMFLPSINFLHLTVSEIQPGQTFPATRPPIKGKNNTPTALKGCGVKSCHILIFILIFHNQGTLEPFFLKKIGTEMFIM